MKFAKHFLACLIALSILVTFLSPGFRNPSLELIKGLGITASQCKHGDKEILRDKLLGGLLTPGLNEQTCLSRYQSSLYRKTSPHIPSPYLLSKLRGYEDIHARCGPGSAYYKEISDSLKSGKNTSSTECKYLVILTRDGLGNRILTMASAFLYALLTNRVLLVDQGNGLVDIFCEPFPQRSWFLPSDFPLRGQFRQFTPRFPQSFGNIRKNNMSIIPPELESLPSYLYLHLAHDASNYDKLFFCDQDQALLKNVPLLITQTNNYIIPAFFFVPSFEKELTKLFPRKDTVFHHISRYLFHPTNEVWGLITRSYDAYLSKAKEKIGIQIRIYHSESPHFEHHMDKILACVQKEKLLPETLNPGTDNITNISLSKNGEVRTVLITSLYSRYQENLKNIYWERPNANGDIIGVYQPSHEEVQNGKEMHIKKALAEIFLLSFSDVLVTSAWSTFGYVAQGLAGVEPWILYKLEDTAFKGLDEWLPHKNENLTAHSLPCERARSMEPCFHAPPLCDCSATTKIDAGKVVPYVKHCEDLSWGIKLFDSDHN